MANNMYIIEIDCCLFDVDDKTALKKAKKLLKKLEKLGFESPDIQNIYYRKFGDLNEAKKIY